LIIEEPYGVLKCSNLCKLTYSSASVPILFVNIKIFAWKTVIFNEGKKDTALHWIERVYTQAVAVSDFPQFLSHHPN
jgi:hypothetical protein